MSDQPTLYRVDHLKRDDIRDIAALVELELPAMMMLLDELRTHLVTVEPVGTLTVGVNPDHGGPDFTIDAELAPLPDGEYLIVSKEADDEAQ